MGIYYNYQTYPHQLVIKNTFTNIALRFAGGDRTRDSWKAPF